MFMFIIGIVSVILLYYLFIKPHYYWTRIGVPQLSGLTIANEYLEIFWHRRHIGERLIDFYNQFKEKRYFGSYQFNVPAIFLRDPELIKQITVKDFDHFTDHRTFMPEDIDPLWARNLFSLTGQRWKEMRSTLSPVFTSSKIKHMFGLISENAEQFTQHFINKNEEVVTVEMKDIVTRFTNDVIANTAFGLKIDSLEDRENEFYLKGKEAVNMNSFLRLLSFIILMCSPRLFKALKLTFFSESVASFFTNVVKDNIESREKNGIVRPDLLHLLMEARKHGLEDDEQDGGDKPKLRKIELSDIDITAQALIFFFAGFDSVATLMCFMTYELAINPDIQKKLVQEINELATNTNGKPEYEDIQKMKYMDMVASETLRKWPNALGVDRVCTKPYTLHATQPGEVTLYIPKDRILWIPIYSLHFDPAYFPEPERFDPERFSDENKANIKPYTYLPFGVGPRNCIGSRFALIETKILMFNLLSAFEIIPVEKTEIPLKISKIQFNMSPANGMWLGLKKRNLSK